MKQSKADVTPAGPAEVVDLDPSNVPKQAKAKKLEPKCSISVPVSKDVDHFGWQLCGQAGLDMGSTQQWKLEHSVQMARYLCVTHVEEAKPVKKEKS